MRCNICEANLGKPLFESASSQVLTSLCELREGRTKVWACTVCGHLRGEELSNVEEYYDLEYRILLDHEDEDQIYELCGDQPIYRTDHQVKILLEKLQLPAGALLLDYGCAKASTPKRLLTKRPDLKIHLFDVSGMYVSHWRRITTPEYYAAYNIPTEWQQRFDVVTSFFALEHIVSPLETVQRIFSLLKDDGVFYGIVPDTFGNIADFVVIDHVNHFTIPSLYRLLEGAGFAQIEIDAVAHRGALIVTARKVGSVSDRLEIGNVLVQASVLARYWGALSDRIRQAESDSGDVAAAIYGSGFYGAYIASSLQRFDRVQCFLDRSPYQQGKTLFGKPVVSPMQLPLVVRTIYVGLNPVIAKAAIAKVHWQSKSDIQLIFLDEQG